MPFVRGSRKMSLVKDVSSGDEEDEDCESGSINPFRILLVGATDVGKSSLINRCIGQEPRLPDGSKNPKAAFTAAVGTGNKGTTTFSRTYVDTAPDIREQTNGRVIHWCDTVGIGTTREDVSNGGLLAELEEMQKMGIKFHVILFCVKATDQAQGLAATVRKIIEFGFLAGHEHTRLRENLILVGTRAEKTTMEIGEYYEKFERDVVTEFFSTACLGDGHGGAWAYTYYKDEKKKPKDCANIFIDDLLSQIKATPNWRNFDQLQTSNCFNYAPPTDIQIEEMFKPLYTSSLSEVQTREQVEAIKLSYQRLRAEIQRISADYEMKTVEIEELKEGEARHVELNKAMRKVIDWKRLKSSEIKDVALARGVDLGSVNMVHQLRAHRGDCRRATTSDWIDFLVEAEFPAANYLAWARQHSMNKNDPPGWRKEVRDKSKRDKSNLSRNYPMFYGPRNESAVSRRDAWKKHLSNMPESSTTASSVNPAHINNAVTGTPATNRDHDEFRPSPAAKRSRAAASGSDGPDPDPDSSDDDYSDGPLGPVALKHYVPLYFRMKFTKSKTPWELRVYDAARDRSGRMHYTKVVTAIWAPGTPKDLDTNPPATVNAALSNARYVCTGKRLPKRRSENVRNQTYVSLECKMTLGNFLDGGGRVRELRQPLAHNDVPRLTAFDVPIA